VTLLLPVVDGHDDRDDIGEAYVLEMLRGQRCPSAGSALHIDAPPGIDDRRIAERPPDPELEQAARDVHGTRNVPGLELVVLSHVEQHAVRLRHHREISVHIRGPDARVHRRDLLVERIRPVLRGGCGRCQPENHKNSSKRARSHELPPRSSTRRL
jgi:hypothetical protein